MALLHSTVRTATVRCVEEGIVFRISRAAYLLSLLESGEDGNEQQQTAGTLTGKMKDRRTHPIETASRWLFSLLGETGEQERKVDYRNLLKAVQEVFLEPGESSFGEESPIGAAIAVVTQGSLTFTGDASKASRDDGIWRVSAFGELCSSTTLNEGDVFAIGRPGDEGILAVLYGHHVDQQQGGAGEGEAASLKNSFRTQNKLRLLGGSHHRCRVEAIDDVRLQLIPLKEYMNLLPISEHLLNSTDAIRCMLLNAPWCRHASSKEIDAMAFSFKAKLIDAGTEIATIGTETEKLTLVVSGCVRIFRDAGDGALALVCEAGPSDVIGEYSISEGEPSLVTARASQACAVLQLPRETYRSMKLQGFAGRARESGMGSANAQIDNPRVHSGSNAVLSDFEMLSIIGQGAFASVAVVQHRDSSPRAAYVMKKMDKSQHLSSPNMQNQIMRERLCMGLLHHPTIAKLYTTFKSDRSLFMLLEPCLGGELYCYMRDVNTLEEWPAAFYTACVVAALEHMHSRDIMYRDLKPENLVISANGYAKLVDFGFAKRSRARTFTLCGTPEYLAPELILMKGHTNAVDWWATGVLLYEMLMGAAPFVWKDEEPYYNLPPTELYKNILNPNFDFYMPDTLSPVAVDLIMKLLGWQPLRRFGYLTDGGEDVKAHEFFSSAGGMAVDWKALYDEKLEPPRMPTLTGDLDLSCFDEAYGDEAFLAEQTCVPASDAWDVDF
jgi:cGMP-dependent protein kinase